MTANKSLIVLNNTVSKYNNRYYIYNIEADRWFPHDEYGDKTNDCSKTYTTREIYHFINNGSFIQIDWPIFKEKLYSLIELDSRCGSIVGKRVKADNDATYLIVAKTIDNEYLYKCSTYVFSALVSDMKIWRLTNE